MGGLSDGGNIGFLTRAGNHIKKNAIDYLVRTALLASLSSIVYGFYGLNIKGAPFLERVKKIESELASSIDIPLGEISARKSELEFLAQKSDDLEREKKTLMGLKGYEDDKSATTTYGIFEIGGLGGLVGAVFLGSYLEHRKRREHFKKLNEKA